MTLNLPIKQGERPLFKSLEILQIIYRDHKRNGNEYETIKSETIIQFVAKIHVFAEILKLRESRGIRNNSNDLFNYLLELPLFFNTQQVKLWEVDRKWNNSNFIPYKDVLIKYESKFDTLTPSELYQPKDDYTEYIWKQWLIQTPIKDIIETLEYSATCLLDWESKRKEKTHLEINIDTLSNYLGISKDISKNWFYLQVLSKIDIDLWSLYLKENNSHNAISELISIWEKSLQLKNNSINSLLYEDSSLMELGFYYPVQKTTSKWDEYWNELEQFKIPNLDKVLLDQQNIIDLFLKENKNTQILPINSFFYLTGLKEKIHLISQLKRGKILIYGKHLSGKKTLVQSIIKELQYKEFRVIHKEHKDNVEKNKTNELRLADKLLSTFENAALVVENVEKNYDLQNSKQLTGNNSLQFFTSSDINEINPRLLKTFDLSIEMESPPLSQRIGLASFFFKDNSIAARVAQSLKEPFEIIRLGSLCQTAQDFSWTHVSLLLSNFSNLYNATQRMNLNKLDNEGDIIPFVGYPELQILLEKLVNYYKNPNAYIEIGAKADKGFLLIGPPGTGKTHFARNLSKIVNIPIFAPDTSVLSANLDLVKNMFCELKKHAPCILFLDEIDTLIANPKTPFGADLEKQKIVNTFLSNIDGIESNDGILIIGTTHRANNFDPAAIRSGRLSKVVSLNLPTQTAREEIWKAHLKNKVVNPAIKFSELSLLSIGFSCADIAEASNKAAILAVESGKKQIEITDLKIACDETFWGYCDPNMVITEKQKKLTAYHEAGHALLAWKNGYNVPRITIRPRQNSLGATHFVGEEGSYTMSMEEIKNKIQVALGGISAENIIFGHYDNGGIGDLKSANELLHHAITEAGLGKEGALYLGDPKLWSNERKIKIETEEKEIMESEFEKTKDYLIHNKHVLEELAATLLEYKEVSGESIDYFKSKLLNYEEVKTHTDQNTDHVLHKN